MSYPNDKIPELVDEGRGELGVEGVVRLIVPVGVKGDLTGKCGGDQ